MKQQADTMRLWTEAEGIYGCDGRSAHDGVSVLLHLQPRMLA